MPFTAKAVTEADAQTMFELYYTFTVKAGMPVPVTNTIKDLSRLHAGLHGEPPRGLPGPCHRSGPLGARLCNLGLVAKTGQLLAKDLAARRSEAHHMSCSACLTRSLASRCWPCESTAGHRTAATKRCKGDSSKPAPWRCDVKASPETSALNPQAAAKATRQNTANKICLSGK